MTVEDENGPDAFASQSSGVNSSSAFDGLDTKEHRINLATNLDRLRSEAPRRVAMEAIAAAARRSRGYIQGLLRQKSIITPEVLDGLAKFYGVMPKWLISKNFADGPLPAAASAPSAPAAGPAQSKIILRPLGRHKQKGTALDSNGLTPEELLKIVEGSPRLQEATFSFIEEAKRLPKDDRWRLAHFVHNQLA